MIRNAVRTSPTAPKTAPQTTAPIAPTIVETATTPVSGAEAAALRGIAVYHSVTSPSELVNYMKAHIARVGVLAEALHQRHLDQFPDVEPSLLRAFSEVHDRSKVATSPSFLRAHGLDKPIANDLLRLWGQSVAGRVDTTVTKLNQIDGALEQAFFDHHHISDDVATQYRTLVSIADKVDRGMNRISKYEEMGRTLRPASEFERDPVHQAFARELEHAYAALIPPSLDYECARFS